VLLNAQNHSHTLAKDAKLREVQVVEVIPEEVSNQKVQFKELSEPQKDALKMIIEKLPPDLSKVQKQKVWKLLLKC